MNIQVTLTGQEIIDLVKNEIITLGEARAFLGFVVDISALPHTHEHGDHEHN